LKTTQAKLLSLGLARWGSGLTLPYARGLSNGHNQRQYKTQESRIGRISSAARVRQGFSPVSRAVAG